MSLPSPTLEGFRAAFRRPSLTFAEIAWRWAVGATAAALVGFYFVEYLDTLPVSKVDSVLLSTRKPMLVGRALAHILSGRLNRAVLAALLVALALTFLWVIAASFGRLAIVRVLIDYFHSEASANLSAKTRGVGKPRPLHALINLNVLRVAMFLAVTLALAGAAILCSFVSTSAGSRPGLAFILFLPLACLIGVAGWALNWWLSLAGIFAVRDGEDASTALSSAVSLVRQRTGPVAAVSTWTGLAHLIAFSVATTAVSFPLAFVRVAPSRIVLAAVTLLMLTYFAVADWLYMARLAGYVCIAEMPEALSSSSPVPGTSAGGIAARVAETIDRDERILSDLPGLI
ncbi:MAG: hypothetical protein WB919_08080 [Candidatus Sulfotelmatobacter sp.]